MIAAGSIVFERNKAWRQVICGLPSALREEVLHRDAAQLKQSADGIFDQVIRARGASGDAHSDFSGRQPVASLDFTVLVQIVMMDDLIGLHFRRVLDKIRWEFG